MSKTENLKNPTTAIARLYKRKYDRMQAAITRKKGFRKARLLKKKKSATTETPSSSSSSASEAATTKATKEAVM